MMFYGPGAKGVSVFLTMYSFSMLTTVLIRTLSHLSSGNSSALLEGFNTWLGRPLYVL